MSTTIFSFGQTSIPTGQFTIPERSVPAGTTRLEIRIARCTTPTPTIWPNAATTLAIALEVSPDGGATWAPGGSTGAAPGGIDVFKGVESPFQGFTAGSSTPFNRVRGTLAVVNGPLVTSGSVQAG